MEIPTHLFVENNKQNINSLLNNFKNNMIDERGVEY